MGKCLILVISSPQFHIPVDWFPAIPAGIQRSRMANWGAMKKISATATTKLRVAKSIESGTCVIGKLPSMALDSGIPAGMTAFPACPDLCITMRAGAWERANLGIAAPAPILHKLHELPEGFDYASK